MCRPDGERSGGPIRSCNMSRSRKSNLLQSTVAICAILGAGLTACGSDDGPTSRGSTASASQSPDQSGAPSTEPAADWQVAETGGAQLKAPADWNVRMDGATYVLSSPKDSAGASVGRGILDVAPTLALSTDDLAKEAKSAAGGNYKKVTRLSDETFGGTPFFHVRGTGGSLTYDHYGAVIGGDQVTITWTFNPDLANQEQIDTWINQVMPTFKFKG